LNSDAKDGFPEARNYLNIERTPRIAFFNKGDYYPYAYFLPHTLDALKSFVEKG
jgi:hypothetical protein